MAAGHNHGDQGHGSPGHSHTNGANTRSLAIALSLTGSFLIAELVGAYWFNSLALLSDAAHMFTDAAALAIALVAVRIGQRSADAQRTYGYRRFEILAAAFNAVLLFVVAGYVLYEGITRFFDPEPVESVGMLAVASLGLVVNLIAMRVLAGGKETSLNMKGAYLEVWADMLGSLGVIAAAIANWLTGKTWIDPIVAIAIGLRPSRHRPCRRPVNGTANDDNTGRDCRIFSCRMADQPQSEKKGSHRNSGAAYQPKLLRSRHDGAFDPWQCRDTQRVT